MNETSIRSATLTRPRLAACLLTLTLLQLFTAHAQAADARLYVRVNQVGYRPADAKVGVALADTQPPERFFVVEATTRREVFEGVAKIVPGGWGRFAHHAALDFSALGKPGRYFLRLGESQSPQFEIGAAAYASLPDELLEFMRQQRCGYNPYLDAVCHPFDGRTAYGPTPAGTYLDATGGWHDAGDQLKYLLTSSNATAQLLLAYLLEKEAARRPSRAFRDGFNERGQPGANGVADVLDEARWGLDWMLKLHPSPRHLYHQVADDRDHIGWRLPDKEKADYGCVRS